MSNTYQKEKTVRRMCVSGILTALVFVLTAYLHIPTVNGFVHVGDGLIYLSACLLPWPYAMAVGAAGALLADCLSGFAIWAPASVVIKAITALLFSNRGDRLLCTRNWLALVPAAVFCAGGYYIYEAFLYQNFVSPLAGIPASLIQSLISSILFIAIGISLDKMNYTVRIRGGL